MVILILALGLTACTNRNTPEKEFADMQKKAARGDVLALYATGRMFEQGVGVTRDCRQAARCYLKAAEKGQAQAQYRLGSLYYHGQGVPKDLSQAAGW